MRFLKSKIARSAEVKRLQLFKQYTSSQESPLKTLSEGGLSPLKHFQRKDSCKSDYSQRTTPCENIIKNYGRAMTNFALSPLAAPYLKTILPKFGSNPITFQGFLKEKKRSVNCIKKLREILPIETSKSAPNFTEKLVFQELCVIFLKNFSVNWLFSSKIDNKATHLNYRFKILRRIKDPDHFTYLKDFKFEKELNSKNINSL